MKRKTKRLGLKRWAALVPLSIFIALTALFKEGFMSVLIPLINKELSLDPKSRSAAAIAYGGIFILILLISYLLSRLYIALKKPDKHYFEPLKFGKPSKENLRKGVDGILNSEKSQPWFVHVAPVSVEIDKIYRALYEKRFVWENGKPGDGKTLLAYHAIFRYRRRLGFSYRLSIKIPWSKCRGYRLVIDRIKETKEIPQVLDELDALKGNRHKIILVDDAHNLPFENALRYEFEEEARQNKNGKVIWINTNYLEIGPQDNPDAVGIAFDEFYPRLMRDFYRSENPLVREVITARCKGLEEAIRMKENGKIHDPWHFNFIASAGEERIAQLLGKISRRNERDLLILAIFLFSARNIITGDKAISQVEFIELLVGAGPPLLQKKMESYTPSRLITDLASQDSGRLLILEHRKELDNVFLKAPHYRMSQAIVKSITDQISDEFMIRMILQAFQNLLTTNYADHIYFGIFFNAIRKCQALLLQENTVWVNGFLTSLVVEKLHVYPFLLTTLKRFHPAFYNLLLTPAYFECVAVQASEAPPSKFKAIQDFIHIFGRNRASFIEKLDVGKMARHASEAAVGQFSQISSVINALGVSKEKHRFLSLLDLAKMALHANEARESQFTQLADFINALQSTKDKDFFISHLDVERLAKSIKTYEVVVFHSIAYLIGAIGYHAQGRKFIVALELEKLAKAANAVELNQLSRVATLLNSLSGHPERTVFIEKLNLDRLAGRIRHAEVGHFNQVADFIIALGGGRKTQDLLNKLAYDQLAEKMNMAQAEQLDQVAGLLNAFGSHPGKRELLERLNWEKVAQTCIQPGAPRLPMLLNFIHALGPCKERLSAYFKLEDIFSYSRLITNKETASFCSLVSSLGEEKQKEVIRKIDWLELLKRQPIHHRIHIRTFTHLLGYLIQKSGEMGEDIRSEDLIREISSREAVIIQYATQYFVYPDDFQPTAKFLDVISQVDMGMAIRITKRLQYLMPRTFAISPRYFIGFANLLEVINRIKPVIAYFLVVDKSIIQKLSDSFGDEDIGEQKPGLAKLLSVIRAINPAQYKKLVEQNAGKMFDLNEIMESYDENTAVDESGTV